MKATAVRIAGSISLFLLLAAPAFAVAPANFGQQERMKHVTISPVPSVTTVPPANQGQLRACQAREKAIRTRLTRLVDLTNTMETKFASIEARVQDYYTTKVLPTGKTVSNYDSLVSDIQVQKTGVLSDLAKAQADVASFSCSSGDPKGQLTQFRVDMQAVKGALKDYRTAIKNLIVAVHSVTGTTERATPEPSK